MNYIVFDLEWNQSNDLKHSLSAIPFEVIEIGAVKYDGRFEQTGQFHELIRPQVYQEMHHVTGRLIHMKMKELMGGGRFQDVMARFLDWCGEDRIFCTWGMMDLTELQRNMKYFGMEPLSRGPIPFLDVQKLYGIAYEDVKNCRSLEYVIDALEIPKDIPFHRAFSDAYYTGKVLQRIQTPKLLENFSYDVYHPPASRDQELKLVSDTYARYISREFPDKKEAFRDPEVSSCKCFLCHRNLKKQIPWFAPNGRQYYCAAYCDSHGYLKGEIRVRHSDEGGTFIDKTVKLITPEELEEVARQEERTRESRKRHRSRRQRGKALKGQGL